MDKIDAALRQANAAVGRLTMANNNEYHPAIDAQLLAAKDHLDLSSRLIDQARVQVAAQARRQDKQNINAAPIDWRGPTGR